MFIKANPQTQKEQINDFIFRKLFKVNGQELAVALKDGSQGSADAFTVLGDAEARDAA